MIRRSGLALALFLVSVGCGNDSARLSTPGQGNEDDDAEPGERDAGPASMRDAKAPSKPLDSSVKPRPVEPGENRGEAGCDTALVITIRDFTEKHPDFESFTREVKGLVLPDLGADKKPVYAHAGSTGATTGPAEFDQWYNDADGVNIRLSHRIEFTEKAEGVYVFDSTSFFPIDDMGFGNGPNEEGIDIPLVGQVGGSTAEHNFLFTTEAHSVFIYRGGETFSFSGDDDMWVFLNDKLAIDLGGTHSELSASISLDQEAARLGIEKGKTYPIDIFHAERHTNESNYHIETTIDLSCIENVPVPFI